MAALSGWYIGRSRARFWAAASLALIALHAAAVAAEAQAAGLPFDAVEPWPLGGGITGASLRAVSLALGLALGWGVPGLSLALLTDRSLLGGRLLARAFGLGIGYILATGLAVALVAGRAPGRAVLLVTLALPPVAAFLFPETSHGVSWDLTLPAALVSMILVTAWQWPKLAHEGLNGDGTEAYELARSLGEGRLPRWDLERPEGPGRYGHPAVNPFLTNSYLVHAQMAVLGRGELAARLSFVSGLVAATFLAAALAGRAGAPAWLYIGMLGAVSVLWNAYYVGYEPAFTDLAEPAGPDLLMTALFLTGAIEVACGSLALGVTSWLLASGVLYSAPLFATVALVALAAEGGERGRRALRLWLVALGSLAVAAVLVGLATDSLPDWIRQLRSEYWQDFVDDSRSVPTLPLLGRLLLATGALPLVAGVRFRSLAPAPRALFVAALAYLLLVAASHHKNLHYLAPVPFLFAPAALQASAPRLQAAAAALLASVFALSCPSPREVHRETQELGERSCLDGVDVENASLGGDVLYQAFARPGRVDRFAVGKHTFARYAADRGGPNCVFRLSPVHKQGWVTVAGRSLAFSVRDVDSYVRWRFSRPAVPSSPLFPRPQPLALPFEPPAWIGRHTLAEITVEALLLDGFVRFESKDPGNPPAYVALRAPPSRLLIPLPEGHTVRIRTWAPESSALALRVNGRPASEAPIQAGWSELALPTTLDPWRAGWNVVELAGDEAMLRHLALDWLEVAPASP